MFDLALRPVKDQLLAPVAERVAGRAPALALTAVGLLVGLGAAAAAAGGAGGPAVALWLGNRVIDGLDGPVARRRGEANDLGGYLDMLADTVVYAVVPLGVAVAVGSTSVWPLTALLLAAFYLNTVSWAYLSALLHKRGADLETSGEPTSIRMPVGLVEGAETIVFYTLFLLFPAWAPVLFPLMAVLVLLGVGQRVLAARRVLSISPRSGEQT